MMVLLAVEMLNWLESGWVRWVGLGGLGQMLMDLVADTAGAG